MKKIYLLGIIVSIAFRANSQCVTNVDFSTWSQAGQPANGNWSVQSGGSVVFQSINGNPTFYITPYNLMNVDVTGSFKTTDGDNDFMGFVWSFLSPLGASDSFNMWLFDWKQQDERGASSGQSVDYANGYIPSSQYNNTFWQHHNTPQFTVVANDFGGPGWITDYNHFFELKLTYTRAIIYVDSVLAFDVTACFQPGRFGFYNYSQGNCYYSNFQYNLYVDFGLQQTKMCQGAIDSFLFVNTCSNADLSQYQTLTWNYGDGDSTVITNPTPANANASHVYNTSGTFNVTLTVVDNNGCSASATHTVQVGSPISLSPVLTPPLCNAGLNGSVSVDPTGGFGGYSYSWNGGANQTQTWSGVGAGTYTVSVTDGTCNATATYNLGQPPALSATTSHTDASCGADNGSVSIQISGGTPPYQNISWAGIPGATLSNIGPGTYIANFDDANGCTAALQYRATVGELPCGVSDNIVSTNVTCYGGNNGTINLNIAGGTPPESIQWSNGMSGASISGLTAGSYSFFYSDGLPGDTFSGTITVTQPTQMAVLLTTTAVVCSGGDDGTALASVFTGGTPPYTYHWSTTGISGPVLDSLSPGTIDVTVTDSLGCTATASGSVSSNPSLVINMVTVDDSCYNSGNGSVIATARGGSLPYTYEWSNLISDSSNLHLIEGTYVLTVTDENHCTATASATVGGPSSAVDYNFTHQDVVCYGTNSGSMNITPFGGNPGYTITWDPDTLSGYNPTNLAAGDYEFTITDAIGCQTTGDDSVIQPDSALTIHAKLISVPCTLTDTVTFSATGGEFPRYYLGDTLTGTQLFTGLPYGAFTISVTDSFGCTVDTTLNVRSSLPPIINAAGLAIVDPHCGLDDGSITGLTVSGGITPYTETWDSNGTNIASGLSVSAIGSGVYMFTVVDSVGCSSDTTINLSNTGGPSLVTSALQVVAANCGQAGSITGLSATGGSLPYTETWDSAGITVGSGFALNNIGVGTFTLVLADSSGCQTDTTISVPGTPAPVKPVASISKDTICAADSASFCVTPTNYVSYRWNNGDTTTCFYSNQAGNYYLTVTDANGCTAQSNRVALFVYPTTPIAITVSGDTLQSHGEVSYQWYFNGQAIAGATTFTFIARGLGIYQLFAIDSFGCQNFSNNITITLNTAITGVADGHDFMLYPNPVSGGTMQLVSSEALIGTEFRIYDIEGRLVYVSKIRNDKTEIDVTQFAKGVYLLQISSTAIKFVKD